jgi:hypothetical protein
MMRRNLNDEQSIKISFLEVFRPTEVTRVKETTRRPMPSWVDKNCSNGVNASLARPPGGVDKNNRNRGNSKRHVARTSSLDYSA